MSCRHRATRPIQLDHGTAMTASSDTTDTAPQEAESFLAMQERVKGTNINE